MVHGLAANKNDESVWKTQKYDYYTIVTIARNKDEKHYYHA